MLGAPREKPGERVDFSNPCVRSDKEFDPGVVVLTNFIEPPLSPVLPLFRSRSEPPLEVDGLNPSQIAQHRYENSYSPTAPQRRHFSTYCASPLSYNQEKISVNNTTRRSSETIISAGPQFDRPIHPLSYSGAGRFWKPPDPRGSVKSRFFKWLKGASRSSSKKPGRSKSSMPTENHAQQAQASVETARNVDQADISDPQVEVGGILYSYKRIISSPDISN